MWSEKGNFDCKHKYLAGRQFCQIDGYTEETNVCVCKSICSAAISSNCEPPGPNYALPEAWEMDYTKRKESVSIALQWINEPLAALLRGHEPADQLKADTLLSNCFQVHVAEKQERMEEEREQQKLMLAVEPEPLPPPQPSAANKKEKRACAKDKQQWNKLYTAVSSKCYLLAETTSKPIRSLLVEEDLTVPGFSIVILKQTNQTTVSDMIEINRRMRGPAEKHEFPVLTEETEADPLSQA
ncbi:UNVERIFIED_CONTAM: hypothetical protein FKN15_032732 [Acipenser sinensis]